MNRTINGQEEFTTGNLYECINEDLFFHLSSQYGY